MKPIYGQLSEFSNQRSNLIAQLEALSPSIKFFEDEIISLRAKKRLFEDDSKNLTREEMHFAPPMPYPCFGCRVTDSFCTHLPLIDRNSEYLISVPDLIAREGARHKAEQVENEIKKKKELLAPIADRRSKIEFDLRNLDDNVNSFLIESFKKINFNDPELLSALTNKDKSLLDFFEKVSAAHSKLNDNSQTECAPIILNYYSCLKLPTANAFTSLNGIGLFKKILKLHEGMSALGKNLSSKNIADLMNLVSFLKLPLSDFKKEIQIKLVLAKAEFSTDYIRCLKEVFEPSDPVLVGVLITILDEPDSNLLNEPHLLTLCDSRQFTLACEYKMLMNKNRMTNTDLLLASAMLTEMETFPKSFSSDYLVKRRNELSLAVTRVLIQLQQESSSHLPLLKWVEQTLLLAQGNKQNYLIILIADYLGAEAIKCAYATPAKIETILVYMELLSLLTKINEPAYSLLINTATKKLFAAYLQLRNPAKITVKSAQIEDELIKFLAKSESSTSDVLLNYFKARIKDFTCGNAEFASLQQSAESASNLQELLDAIQKPIGFLGLLTNSVKNFRNTSGEQAKITEQLKQVLAISSQSNPIEKQKTKQMDEPSTISTSTNSTSYTSSAPQTPIALLTQQSAVFSPSTATSATSTNSTSSNSTTVNNAFLLARLDDIHPPEFEPTSSSSSVQQTRQCEPS